MQSLWGFPVDCGDNQRCCRPGSHGAKVVSAASSFDLCTISVEKRIREEQAWHLQKTFQDLLVRFEDWLWAAEGAAAAPNSSQVSYANSKIELQKFEVLRKQVIDKLLSLESLNRQYNQLAKCSCRGLHLRSTIREINRRWEDLQRRTAAIHKRLKHFVSQREDFELERETIQVWLMDLDLRLTEVEHFSGGTSLEKMVKLQAFQQDVQANADRVDHLLVRGEGLIQRSQPEDAEVLEEELQDLSCFCQDIFRRVFRFRRRLISMRLVFEDAWLSDRESEPDSDGFTDASLEPADEDNAGQTQAALGPIGHSTPKKASLPHKRPGPGVKGTADLEWDPSVDVGGSTSHDENSSYYSTVTGVTQGEEMQDRRRSPSQVSHDLPLRCPSHKDLLVQRDSQEEEDQSDCSGTDLEAKPWEWGAHSVREPPGRQRWPRTGSSNQGEPTGFDPRRIETWLGQSCQGEEERRIRRGQGSPNSAALPVLEPSFLERCQAGGQQAKWQSSKKKSRITLAGQTCKKKRLPNLASETAIPLKKRLEAPELWAGSFPSWKSTRIPSMGGRRMMVAFGIPLLLLIALFMASPSPLYPAEPSCLQANGYARSFHLRLEYWGPPPT